MGKRVSLLLTLGFLLLFFQLVYAVICFIGYSRLKLLDGDNICGIRSTIYREGFVSYRNLLLEYGIGLIVSLVLLFIFHVVATVIREKWVPILVSCCLIVALAITSAAIDLYFFFGRDTLLKYFDKLPESATCQFYQKESMGCVYALSGVSILLGLNLFVHVIVAFTLC